MKTFNLFVVELDKKLHDTITTEGGLELYVDNRFNEFENRVTEGPVVAIPFKYDTGVEEGDTLYFHHLVVLNDGQTLTGEDNNYIVRYDPQHTINNQAIAYKSKKTGEIKHLGGWSFLKPVEEEKEVISNIIEIVDLKEELPTKGEVAFVAPWIEELGLEVGDIVAFQKNRDYRITIDGQEYYRTRSEDLLGVYVEA